MTWVLILTLSLIRLFSGSTGPLSVKIHPEGYAFQGVPIQVEIHIPHNLDNRQLDVILVSEGLEVSHSRVEIQPEDIPVHNYTFKDLDSGEYIIEVVLSQYTSKGWKQVRVRSNTITILDR